MPIGITVPDAATVVPLDPAAPAAAVVPVLAALCELEHALNTNPTDPTQTSATGHRNRPLIITNPPFGSEQDCAA